MPLDYKKTEKEFYQPKTTPSIINVPEMIFIAVDGKGDPNTSEAYQAALEILFGLSYAIKMNKVGSSTPAGYFEYVVPPLEGLWWSPTGETVDYAHKDRFCWTTLIRQPDFVTPTVFEGAKTALSKKKSGLDLEKAQLLKNIEGLCVQVMHIGPYDDEPSTISLMEKYVSENGYAIDINDTRRHHEIYLSDPRKIMADKLKTVIRLPILKRP